MPLLANIELRVGGRRSFIPDVRRGFDFFVHQLYDQHMTPRHRSMRIAPCVSRRSCQRDFARDTRPRLTCSSRAGLANLALRVEQLLTFQLPC